MGYDKAIELIAEFLDLPDFNIFKVGHERIARRIESYNGLIYSLFTQIFHTNYSDKDAKATKLQVLKDYLQPLDCESLSIPDKAIARAKSMLEDDMRAFAMQDGVFITILTTREEA
jgi:hypothetical protein